jgi:hypothetical protein
VSAYLHIAVDCYVSTHRLLLLQQPDRFLGLLGAERASIALLAARLLLQAPWRPSRAQAAVRLLLGCLEGTSKGIPGAGRAGGRNGGRLFSRGRFARRGGPVHGAGHQMEGSDGAWPHISTKRPRLAEDGSRAIAVQSW